MMGDNLWAAKVVGTMWLHKLGKITRDEAIEKLMLLNLTASEAEKWLDRWLKAYGT